MFWKESRQGHRPEPGRTVCRRDRNCRENLPGGREPNLIISGRIPGSCEGRAVGPGPGACRASPPLVRVALVQGFDQPVNAGLLNLLGELIAIVLDQPALLDV